MCMYGYPTVLAKFKFQHSMCRSVRAVLCSTAIKNTNRFVRAITTYTDSQSGLAKLEAHVGGLHNTYMLTESWFRHFMQSLLSRSSSSQKILHSSEDSPIARPDAPSVHAVLLTVLTPAPPLFGPQDKTS